MSGNCHRLIILDNLGGGGMLEVPDFKLDVSKSLSIADRVILSFFRYYEGGVSSVYFWDLDDGFAGVVLLKKSEFPKEIQDS